LRPVGSALGGAAVASMLFLSPPSYAQNHRNERPSYHEAAREREEECLLQPEDIKMDWFVSEMKYGNEKTSKSETWRIRHPVFSAEIAEYVGKETMEYTIENVPRTEGEEKDSISIGFIKKGEAFHFGFGKVLSEEDHRIPAEERTDEIQEGTFCYFVLPKGADLKGLYQTIETMKTKNLGMWGVEYTKRRIFYLPHCEDNPKNILENFDKVCGRISKIAIRREEEFAEDRRRLEGKIETAIRECEKNRDPFMRKIGRMFERDQDPFKKSLQKKYGRDYDVTKMEIKRPEEISEEETIIFRDFGFNIEGDADHGFVEIPELTLRREIDGRGCKFRGIRYKLILKD
jgi:hypothetical protein